MPRRDAVSRSITRLAARPLFCWSLFTSVKLAAASAACASSFGRPVIELVQIVALQRVLILRVALSAADARSCAACR